MLFKTLETQEYLKEADAERKEPSPPPEPVVSEKENEEENHGRYMCLTVQRKIMFIWMRKIECICGFLLHMMYF